MSGLVLLGVFVDMIPAPIFYGPHAVLFFLALGVAEAFALARHSMRTQANAPFASRDVRKFLLLYVAGPLLLGLSSWLIVGKAIPWLFTRAFGEEYRQRVVMTTEHRSSRRACDYRLRGAPVDKAFPDYLCTSEEFYRSNPQRVVLVTLVGKKSVLGINIQKIYSGNPP